MVVNRSVHWIGLGRSAGALIAAASMVAGCGSDSQSSSRPAQPPAFQTSTTPAPTLPPKPSLTVQGKTRDGYAYDASFENLGFAQDVVNAAPGTVQLYATGSGTVRNDNGGHAAPFPVPFIGLAFHETDDNRCREVAFRTADSDICIFLDRDYETVRNNSFATLNPGERFSFTIDSADILGYFEVPEGSSAPQPFAYVAGFCLDVTCVFPPVFSAITPDGRDVTAQLAPAFD